jgi:hypothetical protein
MTDELPQMPDNTPALNPTAQTSIVVPPVPTVVDPSKSVRAVSGPAKLKKIAWRATATVYWMWLIVGLLLGSKFVNLLASTGIVRFGAFLSAIGFAPVHSEYLPRILQFGWLLSLVGFKPLELLGLIIYIYIAPLTLLGYLLFKDYAKDIDATPTAKKGMRPPKVRRPSLTIVGLLLLGWFALYGEASARRPLIAGAILSGLLFLLLAGRAFQRVKPPTYPNGSDPLSADERFTMTFVTSAPETIAKAVAAKKKSELIGNLFIYQKLRSIWRRLALLMRGQAGRNRLHLLLLLDYVVSLLVLGVAALFFWATTAKLAGAPTTSSLATFVRVCASYFLPNIKSPSITPELPLWVQLGSSITAFILFVLFVGAAASLLPSRFTVYAERLNRRYRNARKFAVSFRGIAHVLEKIKLSKPA